jgi:hypothetical protein
MNSVWMGSQWSNSIWLPDVVHPENSTASTDKFDLPVAPWAIDNARRYGWTDLIEAADELNARHAHLASLSQQTRERLYALEAETRWMERDRDSALKGTSRSTNALGGSGNSCRNTAPPSKGAPQIQSRSRQ